MTLEQRSTETGFLSVLAESKNTLATWTETETESEAAHSTETETVRH